MRLGTFWGLTAPMLLLAYDDVDEILPDIYYLRDSVNGEIVRNLHTELYFLKQMQSLLVSEIAKPDGGWFSEINPDAQVMNGQILGSSYPQDVAMIDLKNEISAKIAQKVIDGERSGRLTTLSSPVRKTLDTVALSAMQEDFSMSELHSVVNRAYRSLKSDNGCEVTTQILNEYPSSSKLPDKILRNGSSVELNNDLEKIFMYFYNRMDDVNKLFEATTASTAEDIKVFNSTITDFMRRKPNYMKIVILQWFKYYSNNRTKAALASVVDEVTSSIKTLISVVTKSVVSVDDAQTSIASSPESYSVWNDLQMSGDYTDEELSMIEGIYHRVQNMSPDYLKNKLGVSGDNLDVLFKSACNVGVCGLNTHALALFRESVPNIVMADKFVCHKSQDYLNQLNSNIEDVKALLSNIKPIGTPLN